MACGSSGDEAARSNFSGGLARCSNCVPDKVVGGLVLLVARWTSRVRAGMRTNRVAEGAEEAIGLTNEPLGEFGSELREPEPPLSSL